MTSPYPLDVSTQIYYGGAWHTITSDTRQTSDIVMKWGRADEASVAGPNEMSLVLNNGRSKIDPAVVGRYSLRNPRSDLFGKISRNTPIRARLGDPEGAMLLPSSYDSYASTPDTAVLDITGDIDVRIDADIAWQTTASSGYGLARKYNLTGDQRSWALYTTSTNELQFAWSPDGTLASRIIVSSTVDVPIASGRLAVRVTLDVNNGSGGKTVTFYTADTIDGPWTQLGATVTSAGTTSIFNSNVQVEVGRTHGGVFPGVNAQPLDGKVHAFQLRNGISGTLVANLDLRDHDTGVFATTVDSVGRTWTLNETHIDDLSVRMVGEITDMPVEWDVSGNDVWVPVTAKSISRRLGQGASPLRSALFRDLSNASGIVAYWPMEDGRDATSVAEAFGRRPLVLSGDVSMGAYDGFAGSDSVPTFGNIGTLRGPIPSYTPHARQRVACMLHQSDTQPADRNLIQMTCRGGNVSEAILVLKADGSLRIVLRDFSGTNVLDFSGGVGDLRGENAMIWMLLEQSGANINWQFGKTAEGETFGTIQSGTLVGYSYGRFTTMVLGSAGDLANAALGHVHIINGNDDTGFWNTIFTSLIAWEGETAGDRAIRLCAEQDIPLIFVGDPSTTTPMGKQGSKTLTTLLQECADAELGVLDDHPRIRAKRFRTRETLYNQDVTLTLDYTAHEVAPPLQPVPDDQAVRNDVTVTREGGSSARSIQETGPLNVQDPAADPEGVGRYDTSVSLVLAADSQLADQAGWRKHLGTVNEDRYPLIKINLGHDPHLTDAVKALSSGDRLQITNPPIWLPGSAIDQLVQGGQERLNRFKHEVDLVCTPASPWSVVLVSDGTDDYRADADWSTTAASFVSGTDTSLSVATSQGPLWTTDAGEFPLDIEVSGVVLTVTSISGATSPQTLTVVQTPVNGVTKTIPADSDVRLANPPIVGL